MTKVIMRRDYNFYVYIMASSSGTIYIGVTNNLLKRVIEHKEGKIQGFTKKYSCNKLIYYEYFENIYDAISREKEIKKWRREKKENLIKQINSHWNDLYNELYYNLSFRPERSKGKNRLNWDNKYRSDSSPPPAGEARNDRRVVFLNEKFLAGIEKTNLCLSAYGRHNRFSFPANL